MRRGNMLVLLSSRLSAISREGPPGRAARGGLPLRSASMSRKRSPTPMQMAESATLKAGQWWPEIEKSRKSTTYPKRTRSRRFPTAPPRMSAKPSCRRIDLCEERRAYAETTRKTSTATLFKTMALTEESTEAKRPNAAPLLRTYVRSKRFVDHGRRLMDLEGARDEPLRPLIEEQHGQRNDEVGRPVEGALADPGKGLHGSIFAHAGARPSSTRRQRSQRPVASASGVTFQQRSQREPLALRNRSRSAG